MQTIIASTYEVIQKLGAGGGGNVYLANHLRLNKKVVLKADKRKITTPAELLRREVDVLKNLKHPHIPQVYDFFVENDTVYTVMDYVEGESLDKALKRGERFAQRQVIEWAIQLLEALVYLHSPIHGDPPKGFIHSDIKPANLMVMPDGGICLIDFNIALALGEKNIIGCSVGYASPEHYGLDFSTDSMMSVTDGKVTATAEQATEYVPNDEVTEWADAPKNISTGRGRLKAVTPDVRSDIYSVGATLYHLLSGNRPAKEADHVRPLSRQEFSPQVVDIIEKAMQPNPDLRYQTAAEMLEAFRSLRRNDPRVKSLKRWVRISCTVLGAAFCIGVLSAFVGLKRMQTVESWLKLAEYSQNALQDGNKTAAVSYALQAFPKQKSLLVPQYVPQAQRALAAALGQYDLSDSYRPHGVVELPSAPLCLRLSPDGKTAAAMCAQSLVIIDTESLTVTATLAADQSALAEAEFVDNDRLVYAGQNGLELYSVSQQAVLWTGKPATGISVSEDGQTIAAVYRDESCATLYAADTGAQILQVDFSGKKQQVTGNDIFANPNDNLFALNSDGSMLAASFSDGSVRLFDLNTNEVFTVLEQTPEYGHFEGGFSGHYFAFSASGTQDSVFAVLDIQTMEQTGGYQSQYPFSVYTDANGISVQTENILVRIDPVTGEQTPLVTTSKGIHSYAAGTPHSLVATADSLDFYGENAAQIASYEILQPIDFLCVADGIAVTGSRNGTELRILSFENHSETQEFSYDPAYVHDEARLSADGKNLMLFSYREFCIYNRGGNVIAQVEIPNADQVYDQQFRRQEQSSFLEVIYYDGTVRKYDAATGAELSCEQAAPPDSDLQEEFLTEKFRIVSPLHGAPMVYDRESGKEVAQLSSDAYLTYITQSDAYIIAQFVTTEGEYYGQLLDENFQVLADLPNLCDVLGQTLVFDYPTGDIRSTEICSVEKLLELAEKTA